MYRVNKTKGKLSFPFFYVQILTLRVVYPNHYSYIYHVMRERLTFKTLKMKRQTRKVGVAGGFINQMMGNNSTLPEVGKGATILMYSDRNAYEVIEVTEDGSKCVIRAMDCKWCGIAYGDEQYTYSSNENGITLTMEWSNKKRCWGSTSSKIEIQKSVRDKLVKEYGHGWVDFLPVPYESLIDGEKNGMYTKLKLVKGITKMYKSFYKTSIIFGVMEEYRDPSF